jgi:hypothetical protein
MRISFPLLAGRGARGCLAVFAACAVLTGCQKPHSPTDAPGWYLEKTGDATAQLVYVNRRLKREVWEGTLVDDSVRSTVLSPVRPGEELGVFRWSRSGCAELAFVFTRDHLKCATCMQPAKLVPDSGTCEFDQQRLPVEGWTAVRLALPR